MITPELITTVGFPIALCIYLLVRFEKKLEENTTAIKSIIKYFERGK